MPPPVTRGLSKRATTKASSKRAMDKSPEDAPSLKKRSALEDLTNATKQPKLTSKPVVTRKNVNSRENQVTISEKKPIVYKQSQKVVEELQSGSSTSEQNVSYTTAEESFENDTSDVSLQLSGPTGDTSEAFYDTSVNTPRGLPDGIEDYDKQNWLDPFAASCYAMDIFHYYKEREAKFAVTKYLDRHPRVTCSMRAILVDWLVEVQESFELNHESLYLAVKIIDMFLARTKGIGREMLQLIGATSIYIACKFDERCPPVVDDFLYICDDAYTKKQFITMEIKILQKIDFDLGAPLSYTFLRRYARCANLNMEVLTMARFILEMSLMEYGLITVSDSLIAASALYLALKMKKISDWTPTLEYYSGYKKEDILDLAKRLNVLLRASELSMLKVIRDKYSHKEFFQVAKVEPLQFEDE